MAIQRPGPKAPDLSKPEDQVYDTAAKREEIALALRGSQELEAMTAEISLDDPQSIVKFGSQAATGVSKVSDDILNGMDMSTIDGSKAMMESLTRIMSQFDLDEITEEKKGIFAKLAGGARKQLDRILNKYNTMGQEVDRIYVQLKTYESEIEDSNQKLRSLFQTNAGFYQDLVKYILAGEQALKEMDDYVASLEGDPASAEGMGSMRLQQAKQAREMMDQRVQDLRVAENVALQSIPMLQAIQFGNMNLIRKIDSAFIITLPVFKQALAQAVLLKRQRLQADAMQALDEKTNEMLIKNANNAVAQAAMTARMASGSSIKAETLEQTWKTIMDGIAETSRIQEEVAAQRKADAAKLASLSQAFLETAKHGALPAPGTQS